VKGLAAEVLVDTNGGVRADYDTIATTITL